MTYVLIILFAALAGLTGYLFLGSGSQRRREHMFAVPAWAQADFDFGAFARTGKPNCYVAAPPGTTSVAPDAAAPEFAHSAAALYQLWLQLAAKQPDTQPLWLAEDRLQAQFVQRTKLMRYPDIISVKMLPLGPDRSTLAVYSRSVYGYSDRGVNRRRIQDWFGQLEQKAG
jgi:uncharacterized protein (DUF1499 family)